MVSYSKDELTRLLCELITHHSSLKDVQIVISAGVDTNREYRKGLRPLHYAAYENSYDVIALLIDDAAADVNVADDVGQTPLHVACKHGNYRSVLALLDRKALINFTGDTTGGSASTRALASLTINPLSLAIENNHHCCVEALLRYGADANQKYFLGYEINLVPMEYSRCLTLLLDYGANPDVFSRGGLSPLMKACKNQQLEAVEILIKKKASVNLQCPPKFDQKRALHFAATSGNVDITNTLLKAGAATRRSPEYDHSPLEFAILGDKVNVVRILLRYGADPNEMNEERCAALQIAVSAMGLKNQKQIIELLLKCGGDPNHHCRYFSYLGPSLTPLVEYFGYMDDYDINLVRLLLSYGAKVNMTRPTKLLKIHDPSGILGQIRKLRPYEDILELLINATEQFDLQAIKNESSLSNGQRELLLDNGSLPRDLRHLTRLRIRDALILPILPNIGLLPLPPFLKEYIAFSV